MTTTGWAGGNRPAYGSVRTDPRAYDRGRTMGASGYSDWDRTVAIDSEPA